MIPRLDGGLPGPTTASAEGTPGGRVGTAAPAAPASASVASAADVVPGSPSSERNLELAAVIAALAETGPGATDSATTALQSLAQARLPAEEAALLSRLLQALLPFRPTNETSQALREWLQSGGLLLEAHLRRAIESAPAAEAGQTLRGLAPDLRVLLGRLLHALRPGAGQPPSSGDETAWAPAPGAPRAAAEGQAVADRVLAQQLELAYRWMTDGVLAFELPLCLPGEQAKAFVQFRPDSEAEAPGETAAAAASTISVHVESLALGPIEATARWRASSCSAVLYVATEEALTALHDEAGSFRAGLAALFPQASVDVVLDPARAARRPFGDRPGPLPGGSVVSVRV